MGSANIQNQHILERLAAVQKAVHQLVSAGMTVTFISIEGSSPRISLLYPPSKKNRLPFTSARSYTRTNEAGTRISETSATMAGCEIRWRNK